MATKREALQLIKGEIVRIIGGESLHPFKVGTEVKVVETVVGVGSLSNEFIRVRDEHKVDAYHWLINVRDFEIIKHRNVSEAYIVKRKINGHQFKIGTPVVRVEDDYFKPIGASEGGRGYFMADYEIEPFNLEVGKMYKVVERKHGHNFAIGELVRFEGGDKFDNGKDFWFMGADEVVPAVNGYFVKEQIRHVEAPLTGTDRYVKLTEKEVRTIYQLLNQTDDSEIKGFDPETHEGTYPLWSKFKPLKEQK